MNQTISSFRNYIFSGLLMGVGFVWTSLWFLGIFGIAFFIFSSFKSPSLKIALWGGGVSWFVKSLLVLSWGWSIYPIDWFIFSLPLSGLFAIIFYWVAGAIFISVGGVMVGGILWYLAERKQLISQAVLALPIIWIIAEYISAYFFSMATIGPEGFYNANFSYGQLGYLLANSEITLLLARYGGLYVMGMVAVALGSGLWFLLNTSSPNRQRIILPLTFLVLLLSGHIHFQTDEGVSDNINVAVVDTRFDNQALNDPESKEQKQELVRQAVDAALETGAGYIVLPEGSRYNPAEMPAGQSFNMFRFQTGDSPVILVDSGRAEMSPDTTVLRSTVYDGISKKAWQVDKDYLVPQGEYLPKLFGLILSVSGKKDTAAKLREGFDYVPGSFVYQGGLPTSVPKVLFCFSSADPTAVRDLIKRQDKPVFIAHPISHAWFGESDILMNQQDAMLKIQAVWNGVNIVSAGNMAKGALYTSDGKKIQPTKVSEGEGWEVSLVEW